MKLIELYIENFGGLSRYRLRFADGITTVTEPNGFGKTTLAEFIRAMFYGFPRKSKDLEKSRRQKYAPWNGGQYGGYLVFEHEQHCYRVERSFGVNPRGDSFALIDLETGKKPTRFGEDLGQALFGLDGDSFERSTYLPQLQERGVLTTASILSKLSNLVEDGTDVSNYDKAVAALRAKRSGLAPYRGSGGAIAETAAQITRLQLQLDAARTQEKQLQAAQEAAALAQTEAAQIRDKLEQTSEKLHTASLQAADGLRRAQYDQLRQRQENTAARIARYQKEYPKGFPQEAALLRAQMAAERLKQGSADLAKGCGDITAEQLDMGRSLCDAYTAAQAEIREIQHSMEEIMEAAKAYPGMAQTNSSRFGLIALIAGVAGITAGTVFVLILEWTYGFAFLGIGAMLLVLGITAAGLQRRKCRKREQELRSRQVEAEKKLLELRRRSNAANRCSEEYRVRIVEFFARYGFNVQPPQYPAALQGLERRAERAARQNAEMEEAGKELRIFFDDLGLRPAENAAVRLQQLREDMRALHGAQILLKELTEQMQALEKDGAGALISDKSVAGDLQRLQWEEQQLQEELTAVTTHLLQLQQEIRRLREEAARIPAIQEELRELQQKMTEDRRNVDILDAAIAFLQQARENLATAYLGTIRSRFGHYLSMLQESAGESFFIDTDLQIQLERQGTSRELAYFSAGQTDLVMLCMRLALVDALFRGQEVFLILDDPFVNLDDAHMAKARRLLHTLASERQMLYLTCHSSRTL